MSKKVSGGLPCRRNHSWTDEEEDALRDMIDNGLTFQHRGNYPALADLELTASQFNNKMKALKTEKGMSPGGAKNSDPFGSKLGRHACCDATHSVESSA